MSAFEVVAIDWSEPNVIASFDDREAADNYAERMDGAALRCYVRPVARRFVLIDAVTHARIYADPVPEAEARQLAQRLAPGYRYELLEVDE